MRRNDGIPNKLFIAFSVYTNGKILFDINKSKSPNTINCLLGLRAISVLWIMFGHRFTNTQGFPLTNPNAVREHYNHVYSSILSVYNIAVDTFFVMGALLMTISTLNALENKRLNVPRMIFHRYLRYTPVFAALILYLVSLSKFVSKGPIQLPAVVNQCKDFWWSSLLHIQNYVNPNQPCAGHAW